MSKGTASAKRMIALAFFHRYGWIAAMCGMCMLLPMLSMYTVGISFVLFALWSIIGYQLKWKHIYCSFQNCSHKKMTPYAIHWEKMKKIDIYGCLLLFLILGLILLTMGICR